MASDKRGVKPPEGEWVCLSCKVYDPDDKEQWKKAPCNTCTGTNLKWKPK